jgi:hypothetical protein
MPVNVGFGNKWTHQGHIVKGRQEYSPVQQIKMDIGFKQRVAADMGFATIFRRMIEK